MSTSSSSGTSSPRSRSARRATPTWWTARVGFIAHPDISLVLKRTDMSASPPSRRPAATGGAVPAGGGGYHRPGSPGPAGPDRLRTRGAPRLVRPGRAAAGRGLRAPSGPASILRTTMAGARCGRPGRAGEPAPGPSDGASPSRPFRRAPRGSARAISPTASTSSTGDEVEVLAHEFNRMGRPAGGVLRRARAQGRGAHARAHSRPSSSRPPPRRSCRVISRSPTDVRSAIAGRGRRERSAPLRRRRRATSKSRVEA